MKKISQDIARIITEKSGWKFRLALTISISVAGWGIFAMIYTMEKGLGVWGINNQVCWAWDITNFVFWIGLGHAGTLISAILYLFRRKWRNALNRSAEAMTLFAIICAALFPIVHTGRPWFSIYWLFPYINNMGTWPNFSSPLVWDFFAILIYFIVSIMFWYLGLLPDLALMRNYAKTKKSWALYTFFSLGWVGSQKQWSSHKIAYLLLAGLATPLVLSVHSIVSYDFSVSNVPGWHSTILPPYFVAGAIFSGCAMVVTLLVLTREVLGLKEYITIGHFDNLGKIILTSGLIVTYSYFVEYFGKSFSGAFYGKSEMLNLHLNNYFPVFWLMILFTVIIPQLLWSKKIRTNTTWLLIISLLINVGMWLERFNIVVGSLSGGYLPATWRFYSPTWVEVSIFLGTIGIFISLYLIFIRFIPIISISEMKALLSKDVHYVEKYHKQNTEF